jgi:hypothetical protein
MASCEQHHKNLVILSEARDLLSIALPRQQILRFAQDDKIKLRLKADG